MVQIQIKLFSGACFFMRDRLKVYISTDLLKQTLTLFLQVTDILLLLTFPLIAMVTLAHPYLQPTTLQL